MQRAIRPDGLDTSVGSLRSPSVSSDVMSNSAKSLNNAVPVSNPPPAYIASNGASNLISSELDRTVLVSPLALDLVNQFLDQVLFNILATSRSTSLNSLRAAVPSVLKPRLGKAAVRAAEEDLNEYLDDEEEAEVDTKKAALEPKHTFDTELAWKLARLRCMVYAQLGDLEEEDEEEWLEKEQLLEQVETRKDTHGEIQLGPAAAIFLASVIEYLGEQALFYAAQHAQKRMVATRAQESAVKDGPARTLTPKTDEIVLEGKDMNHIGRDSPLSRLWRSWRRNTRDANSRQMSPEATHSGIMYSPSHSRNGSQVLGIHQIAEEQKGDLQQEQSPSQIPLPMRDNDIDEIEVPGLAPALSDAEDDVDDLPDEGRRRPLSMAIMPGAFPDALVTTSNEATEVPAPPQNSYRPYLERQRSMSSPTPIKQHFSLWKPYTPSSIPQEATADSEEHPDRSGRGTPSRSIGLEQEVLDTTTGEAGAQSPVSPSSPQSSTSPQTPKSTSAAARRGRSSPREPGSPNKRDGMVGGPVEAAMGAAGAAGAALLLDGQRQRPLQELRTESGSGPKQTVADEMLRTQDAVAPPKDATTAASITNVADFDSMYVPMEMPAEAKRGTTSEVAKQIPAQHKSTTSQSSISMSAAALQRKPLPAQPVEDEDPAPAVATPSLQTDGGSQTKRQMNEMDISAPPPQAQQAESPVSPLPLSDHRPPTSSSNVSEGNEAPAHPPDALRSHPTTQVYSGSQLSLHSQHSKSSSASSRALGHSRDASGKFPTGYQHYGSSAAADQNRAPYPPTSTRGTRETRSSTASSSTSKLVGKNQTPIHSAIHSTKLSDDIDADKKKSLEILIRSNETLHYTLTPANVMQTHQSALPPQQRSETQDMADFIRSTGPPASETSRFANSAATADPAATRSAMVRSPAGERVIPSSQKYSQSSSLPGRPRNPLGQARDPRTERSTTMRDLADYARSTGPLNDSQLPQPLSPRLPVAGSVRNTIVNQHKQPTQGKPKNRIKLEARDPRPSRTADNSDLIDFIREGPPRAAGDHRIDRRVAPFRRTMDSEDLNSLAPNVDKDLPTAYAASSANNDRSVAPSVNSQTALLTSGRRPVNGSNTLHTSRSQPLRQPSDDGLPKRTRRRVKDPYAISDSDDDDYLLEETEKRQAGNEESLIDFLRNTAPPPGAQALPIHTSQAGNGKSPNLAQTQGNTGAGRGTQGPTARPTQLNLAERQKIKSTYEAREARPRRNDTSELASYLRSSGPPPSANLDPQPFSQNQAYQTQKDDGGLMRMFTKRKVK